MTVLTPRPNSRTDREKIEIGLRALALASDSSRRASSACGTPEGTLREWKKLYPEDYARIQEEVLPEVERQVAEGTDRVAQALTEVEERAASILHEKLADDEQVAKLSLKDVSGTMRDASVSKGINIQRGGELRGRPTVIHEHRSVEALIRAYQKRGLGVEYDHEGTASEVETQALESNKGQTEA